MGLIESGDGLEIIQPGPGKIRLRLDGFQDNSDGKFPALKGEVEALLRRLQGALCRLNLVPVGLPAGVFIHHLPRQIIPEFLNLQFAQLQPRIRGGTCGSLGGDLELISLYAAATGCYNRANAAESLEPESRNRDGAPPIDFW